MATDKHEDVEFMIKVSEGSGVKTMHFDTSEEASAVAISQSVSRGGEPVVIDVLVMSKAGARWYGGDHGLEVYEEDPDASVHERITVRAWSNGRVA